MREENVLRMNFCLHEGKYEMSELLKLYNIFLLPLESVLFFLCFFFTLTSWNNYKNWRQKKSERKFKKFLSFLLSSDYMLKSLRCIFKFEVILHKLQCKFSIEIEVKSQWCLLVSPPSFIKCQDVLIREMSELFGRSFHF
jgi:hypothetical protein